MLPENNTHLLKLNYLLLQLHVIVALRKLKYMVMVKERL